MLGGLLTSASPCVLAPRRTGGGRLCRRQGVLPLALGFVAGMNLSLLVMGLLAARLEL